MTEETQDEPCPPLLLTSFVQRWKQMDMEIGYRDNLILNRSVCLFKAFDHVAVRKYTCIKIIKDISINKISHVHILIKILCAF